MSVSRRDRRGDFRKFVEQNAPNLPILEQGDLRMVSFEKGGMLDCDLYCEIQSRGNRYKLDQQWVPERHVGILADYIVSQKLAPDCGICHGTRQGFEQTYFRR